MPLAFLNSRRGKGVELDPDVVFGFRRLGKYAEAFSQKFADREVEGASEFCFADTQVTNSRQRKGAELLAIDIEREEVPEVFNAPEVIRLDVSRLVRFSLGFLVIESDLEL